MTSSYDCRERVPGNSIYSLDYRSSRNGSVCDSIAMYQPLYSHMADSQPIALPYYLSFYQYCHGILVSLLGNSKSGIHMFTAWVMPGKSFSVPVDGYCWRSHSYFFWYLWWQATFSLAPSYSTLLLKMQSVASFLGWFRWSSVSLVPSLAQWPEYTGYHLYVSLTIKNCSTWFLIGGWGYLTWFLISIRKYLCNNHSHYGQHRSPVPGSCWISCLPPSQLLPRLSGIYKHHVWI